jgi:hypothetical protein
MSNSIGDLKNSGLQGNNFPWQLKMLEGLQKIYDEVKKPLTCAEDSITICNTASIPVTVDCNDRISLCVNGTIVNSTNPLPTTASITFPASLAVTQDPSSNPWTVDGAVDSQSSTLDGAGNPITSSTSGGTTGLDINQIPFIRTPNILSTTGTGIIAPVVYSISFSNIGPDPELITFDAGANYTIIPAGVSVTMDAGGNNSYPAGVFGYDVIGTGPILIVYNT